MEKNRGTFIPAHMLPNLIVTLTRLTNTLMFFTYKAKSWPCDQLQYLYAPMHEQIYKSWTNWMLWLWVCITDDLISRPSRNSLISRNWRSETLPICYLFLSQIGRDHSNLSCGAIDVGPKNLALRWGPHKTWPSQQCWSEADYLRGAG